MKGKELLLDVWRKNGSVATVKSHSVLRVTVPENILPPAVVGDEVAFDPVLLEKANRVRRHAWDIAATLDSDFPGGNAMSPHFSGSVKVQAQ